MSADQAVFPIATMAHVLGMSKGGPLTRRHPPSSLHAGTVTALLRRGPDDARQLAPDLRRTTGSR